MEFVSIPHLSITPSKCVFCGSTTGPFIVSQQETWIEGYGIIAICAENTDDRAGCLVQAARLAGCVDEPVHAKVGRQAAYWEDCFKRLEAELAPLRELSDAVAKIQPNRNGGEDAADSDGNDRSTEAALAAGAAGPRGQVSPGS